MRLELARARAAACAPASTRSRAACRDRRRRGSGAVAKQRTTSSAVSASKISAPGWNSSSSPGQTSLMIGTPQLAASNRRTQGDQPAATMSARVTFR